MSPGAAWQQTCARSSVLAAPQVAATLELKAGYNSPAQVLSFRVRQRLRKLNVVALQGTQRHDQSDAT